MRVVWPLKRGFFSFGQDNFWAGGLVILLVVFSFFVFSPPLLVSFREEPEFSFSPLPLPRVKEGEKPPSLSARSYLVMDVDSGTIIVSSEPFVSLPPASLTKMMTALIVREYYSLDQVLVVRKDYPVGKIMGLREGEKMRVRDLLLGLMIHSANDAAWVLADNYPGGVTEFVAAMNRKGKELGFVRTRWSNFDGEDDQGHYATVFELAQLARLFLKDEFLARIVQLKKVRVFDVEGKREFLLENTNELLGVMPEAKGLKTGWTYQAGECFTGFFEIDDQKEKKRRLLSVVLGSRDRFGETERLIRWVKKNVFWEDYSVHSTETAATKATKSLSPSKT